MSFHQHHIKEIQRLYAQSYHKEVSEKEAQAYAINLINYIKAILNASHNNEK